MRYSIIRRILYMLTVICLTLSIVMPLSCYRPSKVVQYIEPLGLFFQIQRKDTTVMISFGENKDSSYPNYFEIYHNTGDCDGSPFYFAVDNTSAAPRIKHIFFIPMIFFDIHIPDYPYSIDYFVTQDFNSFRAHVEKLTKLDRDSIDLPDHYVVRVWPTAYDRYLDYYIYDTGDIDDMETFITSFVENPMVRTYPDLKEMGQQLDYIKNHIDYGEPTVCEQVIVNDRNREEMMKAGWLFLDTLDISEGPVLEIDKWKVDDDILSIIYRVGPDVDRTPVNGARYIYAMERLKDMIYYQ